MDADSQQQRGIGMLFRPLPPASAEQKIVDEYERRHSAVVRFVLAALKYAGGAIAALIALSYLRFFAEMISFFIPA